MIAKTDIILLLTEMQKAGLDTANDIKQVLNSNVIPLDIIRKINDYKSIDIVNFYDKLRKSYNDKHSKLYKNIMKSDENLLNDPKSALTTLSALFSLVLVTQRYSFRLPQTREFQIKAFRVSTKC